MDDEEDWGAEGGGQERVALTWSDGVASNACRGVTRGLQAALEAHRLQEGRGLLRGRRV